MDPELEDRINQKPLLVVDEPIWGKSRGCLFWAACIAVTVGFILSWVWPETFGTLSDNAARIARLLRFL